MPRSPVDKHDHEAVPSDGDAVAEANVQVHDVQVLVEVPVDQGTAVRGPDGGVRAEGWRELSSVDELPVPRALKQVPVVLELTSARRDVEVLRRPAGPHVARPRCVAGAHWWRCDAGPV